jgi:parallel beta-helix repeat protein
MAQDGADRYINSYSSTNGTYTIQSILSTGTITHIKDGVYNTILLQPVSNSKIIGEGNNTIIKLLPSANTPLIYIGDYENIEITNMNLDGNGANQLAASYSQCIKNGGGSSVFIHDNYIHDSCSSLIDVGYSNVNISDVRVYNNILENAGINQVGDGIGLEPTTSYYILDSSVKGNTITNCYRYGVMSYNRVINSEIVNNVISNSGENDTTGDGIRVTDSGNLIQGNQIKDITATSARGIGLTDSATKNTVVSNTVSNSNAGIVLSGSPVQKNLVSNNQIINCFNGIYENNNAYLNNFQSNNIQNAGGTISLDINASSTSGGNTVNGTLIAETNYNIRYGYTLNAVDLGSFNNPFNPLVPDLVFLSPQTGDQHVIAVVNTKTSATITYNLYFTNGTIVTSPIPFVGYIIVLDAENY